MRPFRRQSGASGKTSVTSVKGGETATTGGVSDRPPPARSTDIRRLVRTEVGYSSAMGRPIDTSTEARERQLEAYRTMTPEYRLRLADELTKAVRALADSGTRARGGDPGDSDVDLGSARARAVAKRG